MRHNIDIKTVTPAKEHISLDQAKSFLQLDGYSDEDELIQELIGASREYAEQFTKRLFVKRQVTEYRDTFDEPHPVQTSYRGQTIHTCYPISAMLDISYIYNNTEETMTAESYQADVQGSTTIIVLNQGYSWPITDAGIGKVILRYESGYPVTPAKVIIAQKKLIRTWYDERYDGIRRHPSMVDNLLASYIRYH